MSEVRCFYKFSEKKTKELESWVKAHDQRYVVFLEDDNTKPVWSLPHPRMRCFVFSEESRKKTLEQIAWEFLYLPFSFEDPHHPLLKELGDIRTEINYWAFDFADQGSQLLQNYRFNLKPTQLGQDLFGKFTNVPAIVCGGGPSLAAEKEALKKLERQAVIIGCGAGMEALLNLGVTPHFAAHVDAAPIHQFTATKTPLFYQLRTNGHVVSQYTGPRFLLPGCGNFAIERWLHQKLGLEEVMDGGWTVGTFGVKIAVALGCNPIILAGIDLSALPHQIYAPGVKTRATTEGFVLAKNREGGSVLSRPDWVLAAEWLEKFAAAHPDRKWGTLSKQGLPIPSIPVVTLADLLGVSHSVSLETPLIDGSSHWTEMSASLHRCGEICRKILTEIEKIYPQHPLEHHATALLEHDLSEQLACTQVLDPLWHYWKWVIERHNVAGECGLYLHRILFFQSICGRIDA